MIIGLFLAGVFTMFHIEHAEFFETVRQQQEKGYTWHYVGEQLVPENTKSIPWRNEEIGKDVIFYQLKK